MATTKKATPVQQPKPYFERADILKMAGDNVCGRREQDYGAPENNFALIAEFWSKYLDIPTITATDVAMMMVLLKVARVSNSPTLDSVVDIAGYAACAGEIEKYAREEKASE